MAVSVLDVNPTTTSEVSPRRRRRLGYERRRAGYLMVAPAVLHMIWWIGIPVVMTFVLAFTNYDVLAGTARFVGLDNFTAIFSDGEWNASMWHTLVYTFFTVPVAMAAALVLAVMLNMNLRGRAWYRTAFFLPQVTAGVAVAIVWAWMFEPRVGLINAFLSLFGVNGPAWLSDPHWAMPAVIFVGIWKGIGVKLLIYLAALQNIPREVHEAAEIDGTSPARKLWSITLPLLRPATFFVFVVSMIEAFQVFDTIYVLTPMGGPANATTVMTYEIYQAAFGQFRIGTACAESVVLFVFLASVSVAGRKFTGRDDVAR